MQQPLQRFELVMRRALESFAGTSGLWHAQLELVELAQRNEELRGFLAGIQEFAGTGLAELLLGVEPGADPDAARAAGFILHAMFIGLIAKYFLDPARAPSAAELADGLRIIAEIITGQAP